MAGNYLIRYLFACAGTAVCLPAIEAIGVGWFSTISSVFLIASAGLTWAVTIWGRGWREAVDRRKEKKKARQMEKRNEKDNEDSPGSDNGNRSGSEVEDHE